LYRGSAGYIDQFVAGHLALLDQIHHRQQLLPVAGKELAQPPRVHVPLFVDRVIVSFHGGLLSGLAPDSFIKNQAKPPLNFQLRSGNPPVMCSTSLAANFRIADEITNSNRPFSK
jgi:hypothetical protein